MEEVLTEIKANVLLLDSSISEGDKLDLITESVVNRALIYTNRQQLVEQGVDIAIPDALRVPLAEAVVKAYNGTTEKIDSMKDHEQTIKYSNVGDAGILTELKVILNKYRIATIYKSL